MKIKYREIDESVHLSPYEITTISAMSDELERLCASLRGDSKTQMTMSLIEFKLKGLLDVRFRNRKEYRKVSIYEGNFRTEGSERFYSCD